MYKAIYQWNIVNVLSIFSLCARGQWSSWISDRWEHCSVTCGGMGKQVMTYKRHCRTEKCVGANKKSVYEICDTETVCKDPPLPRTCADLKKQDGVQADGEYFLFPVSFVGLSIKVYCHNMTGDPKEYISFSGASYNGVHYPDTSNLNCSGKEKKARANAKTGFVRFFKIGIDIKTMVVNRYDFTFVSDHAHLIPYGRAMDCYNDSIEGVPFTCDVKGSAMINFVETKLTLDPAIKWVVKGNKTVLGSHTISYRGQVHSIRCGGYCGYCDPDRPLKLIFFTGSRYYSNCTHIKQVDWTYIDKHYILFPEAAQFLEFSVFCYNMSGSPREYFTFFHYNGGQYPNESIFDCSGKNTTAPAVSPKPGKIVFNKVRIDVRTMEIMSDDYTFAEVEGNPIPYGYAGDCFVIHGKTESSCGARGIFVMDTRQTQMIIDPDAWWKATGYKAILARYKVINDGEVRILRCGGYCGMCVPLRPIRLIHKSLFQGWSPWIRVSARLCSSTCGNGTMQAFYKRTCKKDHQYKCVGNVVKKSDVVFCYSGYPCKIDGGWGEWGAAHNTSCSVSCGSGVLVTSYTRLCDDPKPLYGGRLCPGPHVRKISQMCSTNITCPIDGVWSSWAAYNISKCASSCGMGKYALFYYRSCDNPKPQYAGKPCVGRQNKISFKKCNTNISCAKNGVWSPWVKNKTEECHCGVTQVLYTRSCIKPLSRVLQCNGRTEKIESEKCYTNTSCLPADGFWSTWTENGSGPCDKFCYQTVSLFRTCHNPPCKGESTVNRRMRCLTKKCVFALHMKAKEKGNNLLIIMLIICSIFLVGIAIYMYMWSQKPTKIEARSV